MTEELWIIGVEAADHAGKQQRHAYGPYSTREAAEDGLSALSAHHFAIEAATILPLDQIPADYRPLVDQWRVEQKQYQTRDLFSEPA